MRYAPLILLVLAACGDDGGETNPSTLWLAPDGSEIRVKLVESEPRPW